MDRKRVVIVGLGLFGAVVGLVLGEAARVPPIPAAVELTGVTSITAAGIVVHVSGWVLAPGVVQVPEGALVFDAIAAAGGALVGARLDGINLARPVASGDQIGVPGPDVSISGGAGAAGDGLIDLNRADSSQLQKLPGVGPVLAERIVARREANGPYRSVEDLLEVPGIGESKLVSIRDLVLVR